MEQKIRALIKEAMIEKNKMKQLTYKSVLENAQKTAKNDGNRNVCDADFVKALKTEIKTIEDVKPYVKDDQKRLTELEEKIVYCKDLLPTMASEEEIKNFLKTADLPANIGAYMKALKTHFGDALDGKLAQQIVKTILS